MAKIHEIGLDLDSTTQVCQFGRLNIQKAEENIVKGGFTVIASHKKKMNLMKVDYFLSKIQEVKSREIFIKDLVNDGNIPDALQKMIELSDFMGQFQYIYCIKEFSKKTEDFYKFIKDKIDDSLAFVLNQFDASRYEKVLIGCKLLGNIHINTKISNYYKKTIDKVLQQVSLPFLLNLQMGEEMYSKPFEELCLFIQKDDLISIVLQALSVLSDMIYNFYQLYLWHQEKDDYENIKAFVTSYRKNFWETIQNKLCSLVNYSKFNISLDSFLQIYHGIDMFCDLGEEFSQSDSNALRGTLKNRCKIFFTNYHKSKIEEFKLMFENEKFLKLDSNLLEEFQVSNSHNEMLAQHQKMIKLFLKGDVTQNYFRKGAENERFTLGIDVLDGKKKDIKKPEDSSSSSSSSSSSDEEEKEEKVIIKNPNQIIYTSSSIRVIQIFHKYFYAMQVLKPIAQDIFFCFGIVFNFYIYSLHSFFGNLTKEPIFPEQDPNISDQLRVSYKLLRDNLNKIQKENTKQDGAIFPALRTININEVLKAPNYGLMERTIGLETLNSILSCVNNLAPFLQELLPKSKEKWVFEFKSEMELIANEVIELILIRTISFFINVSSLPTQISSLTWENGNFDAIQSNKYVDQLIKDFKEYSKKLVLVHQVISKNLLNKFWEIPINQTMNNLVEGYSRVKKCDPMGRSIMKYDLSNLEQGLKKYCSLDPIPKVNYVKIYIEGYHYPPEQIWEWIQSHYLEYTKSQIESLIVTGPGTKMKSAALKELLIKIEKLEELKKQKMQMMSPRERQSLDQSRPSLDNQRPNVSKQTKSFWGGLGEYFGY